MDQGGTPLWSSPRTPSIHWGIICQDWSRGLEVTSGQPKGVKLGISKIAFYNRSWMARLSSRSVRNTFRRSKYFRGRVRLRTRVKNSEWQIQNWWVNFSDETNSVRLFHMDKFRCNSNITLDKFRWYFLIWTNLD